MYVIIFGNIHTGVRRVTGPFSSILEAREWIIVHEVPEGFANVKALMPITDLKWRDPA